MYEIIATQLLWFRGYIYTFKVCCLKQFCKRMRQVYVFFTAISGRLMTLIRVVDFVHFAFSIIGSILNLKRSAALILSNRIIFVGWCKIVRKICLSRCFLDQNNKIK